MNVSGFQYFNSNPKKKQVGDCVIRAISKALGKNWEWVYIRLCLQGFIMCDWGNSNAVWGAFLKNQGFSRYVIPADCPDCYSVADFAADHPEGTYILATGSHVVCLCDGNWFDSWDSGGEIPVYFFVKEE